MELLQIHEFEGNELKNSISRAFDLIAVHFDILNPWDLAENERMQANPN